MQTGDLSANRGPQSAKREQLSISAGCQPGNRDLGVQARISWCKRETVGCEQRSSECKQGTAGHEPRTLWCTQGSRGARREAGDAPHSPGEQRLDAALRARRMSGLRWTGAWAAPLRRAGGAGGAGGTPRGVRQRGDTHGDTHGDRRGNAGSGGAAPALHTGALGTTPGGLEGTGGAVPGAGGAGGAQARPATRGPRTRPGQRWMQTRFHLNGPPGMGTQLSPRSSPHCVPPPSFVFLPWAFFGPPRPGRVRWRPGTMIIRPHSSVPGRPGDGFLSGNWESPPSWRQ